MKKFFLDQFYIQKITSENNGQLKLQCLGMYEEQSFTFNLYLSGKEFSYFLSTLKDKGRRIKKWLSKAFFVDILQLFKYAVAVDSCWLTIKVVELNETYETDKEYCVENFGFIPEEL